MDPPVASQTSTDDDRFSRDVFVSYAREDEAWVRSFVGWLRGEELSVWWDREDYFGARDRRQIEELAIRGCAAFVFVASKSSTNPDLSGGYWGELRSAIKRSRDLNRQFLFVVHRHEGLQVPALAMSDDGTLSDVPRFEMWRKPRKATPDWQRHQEECSKLIRALSTEAGRKRISTKTRAKTPFIPADAWHQLGEWLLSQIIRPLVLRQCSATMLVLVAALLVMSGSAGLFNMLRVNVGWLPHIATGLAALGSIYTIWMDPGRVPLLVPRRQTANKVRSPAKRRQSGKLRSPSPEPIPKRGIFVSGVFAVALASLAANYGAQGLWLQLWPDPRQLSAQYEQVWWFSGTVSLIVICCLLFFLLGVSRRNGHGWMSAPGKAAQAAVSVVFAAFCWLTLMPPEHPAIVLQVDQLLQNNTTAAEWTALGDASNPAATDGGNETDNGSDEAPNRHMEPLRDYLNAPDTIVKVSRYHETMVPGMHLNRLTFPVFIRFCALPVVAAIACLFGSLCRGSDDAL